VQPGDQTREFSAKRHSFFQDCLLSFVARLTLDARKPMRRLTFLDQARNDNAIFNL
jgi:hypothetical protein